MGREIIPPSPIKNIFQKINLDDPYLQHPDGRFTDLEFLELFFAGVKGMFQKEFPSNLLLERAEEVLFIAICELKKEGKVSAQFCMDNYTMEQLVFYTYYAKRSSLMAQYMEVHHNG